MALSSLPCLTPPFMSASLATLSFPPLPLLSLHLASFPCLPPSPSHCTWLCWLPLHHSCHPPSQDPVLSSPDPQPPAPTSPALASCPHAGSAPPSSPSPAQNLPLPCGGRRGVAQSPPRCSPSMSKKSFSPFLPSVLLSSPGCFQGHSPLRVCPALSQPGILFPLHLPHGSNELGMLVDPDVPPCHWHPPSSSSAPAGGQRKGTHLCSSQGWALPVRGLWCPSHTPREAWGVSGGRGPHAGLRG